jgi:TRAP-type C4-dicarboxylate transport system permease small subunit
VFFAAAFRWFGVSVAWSIDIAQLLFSWICFIGADLALRTDSHVGVDILTRRLPANVRILISFILDLMVLAFVASIFYFGSVLCVQNYRRIFNTVPISYSFVTLSAPVGAFLMGLTTTVRLKTHINNIIEKKDTLDETI